MYESVMKVWYNTPAEVTHKPCFLMESVRYYSHNCCFQFSSLFSQRYLSINQNRLGFENRFFCSCSISAFLSCLVNTSGATHWNPHPHHPSLSFVPYVPDVWSSFALTHENTHSCGFLSNLSKILRSKRQSEPQALLFNRQQIETHYSVFIASKGNNHQFP